MLADRNIANIPFSSSVWYSGDLFLFCSFRRHTRLEILFFQLFATNMNSRRSLLIFSPGTTSSSLSFPVTLTPTPSKSMRHVFHGSFYTSLNREIHQVCPVMCAIRSDGVLNIFRSVGNSLKTTDIVTSPARGYVRPIVSRTCPVDYSRYYLGTVHLTDSFSGRVPGHFRLPGNDN